MVKKMCRGGVQDSGGDRTTVFTVVLYSPDHSLSLACNKKYDIKYVVLCGRMQSTTTLCHTVLCGRPYVDDITLYFMSLPLLLSSLALSLSFIFERAVALWHSFLVLPRSGSPPLCQILRRE